MEPFLKTPPHPPPKKEKHPQQKSATVVSNVGGGGGGGGVWSKEKVLLKDGQSFIMCLLHCITNHIPGVINAESEIHSPPLLPAPETTSAVDWIAIFNQSLQLHRVTVSYQRPIFLDSTEIKPPPPKKSTQGYQRFSLQ